MNAVPKIAMYTTEQKNCLDILMSLHQESRTCSDMIMRDEILLLAADVLDAVGCEGMAGAFRAYAVCPVIGNQAPFHSNEAFEAWKPKFNEDYYNIRHYFMFGFYAYAD